MTETGPVCCPVDDRLCGEDCIFYPDNCSPRRERDAKQPGVLDTPQGQAFLDRLTGERDTGELLPSRPCCLAPVKRALWGPLNPWRIMARFEAGRRFIEWRDKRRLEAQ
jgi:hypothetical protein